MCPGRVANSKTVFPHHRARRSSTGWRQKTTVCVGARGGEPLRASPPAGPQAATRCPAAHPTARPRLRRASIPGSLSLSLSHSTRSPLLPATRHPTPANIPRKRARRPALRSSAACLPAHVRAASRRPLAPPVSSTTSPLLRLEGGAAAWSCTSRAPPCRAQWRTARKGGWPSAARTAQTHPSSR